METKHKTICHICKIPMDDHNIEQERICLHKFLSNESLKTYHNYKGKLNKNGNIPQ